LRRAKELAKDSSKLNLAGLLPKLKKSHLDQNMLAIDRQDKIIEILKGDRFVPELNSPSGSRKFYRSEAKVQMKDNF